MNYYDYPLQTAWIDLRDNGADITMRRFVHWPELKEHIDSLRKDGYRARVIKVDRP